jgi:arginyl-tRNA synthetase
MPRMEKTLQELKSALLALAPGGGADFEPAISRPPNPDLGDLAVAVFPLAKALGRPPQQISQEWAERIPAGTQLAPGLTVERAQGAGGFLNLRFETPSLMREVCAAVTEEGPGYGAVSLGAGVRAMVEYSSPNTNKPLHLGHVRNNVIGMSLSNILEAGGYEVIRANLVNDRGIHICKSMLAYSTWGQGETPATAREKGDHFVGRYYVRFDTALKEERTEYFHREGIDPASLEREARDEAEDRFLAWSSWQRNAQRLLQKWEEGDPETLALWRKMNDWVYAGFRETYERLGCRFERWYFESETWQLGKSEVERGLGMGVFYRKEDGSVWAHLEPYGLQDKLVLRSNGTSVYITQDIGTAVKKHKDYRMDRSLYVVGAEQILHFKNLFAILKALGFPWADGCTHVAYNLIILPRGMGKLKSREGTAVDADDLLDVLHEEAKKKIAEGGYCGDDPERVEATAEAIGQGALKVYLLQVGNDKNITFDPAEKLTFEGDTGPAIQYSHARICGIVRKGLERGVIAESDLVPAADAPAGVYAGVRTETFDPARLDSPEERDIALRLLEFPFALALANRQLSAAPIANYLLELTRAYARFYHEHRVLEAPDTETRLARLHLSLNVAQVLRRGLRLLTVEAPDRM